MWLNLLYAVFKEKWHFLHQNQSLDPTQHEWHVWRGMRGSITSNKWNKSQGECPTYGKILLLESTRCSDICLSELWAFLLSLFVLFAYALWSWCGGRHWGGAVPWCHNIWVLDVHRGHYSWLWNWTWLLDIYRLNICILQCIRPMWTLQDKLRGHFNQKGLFSSSAEHKRRYFEEQTLSKTTLDAIVFHKKKNTEERKSHR